MVTKEESWKIFKQCFQDEIEVLGLKNHKESKFKENTFQATVNILSLDILFALMEVDMVKNVYFHPSSPPPGSGADPIAMRYRLYVEYYGEE